MATEETVVVVVVATGETVEAAVASEEDEAEEHPVAAVEVEQEQEFKCFGMLPTMFYCALSNFGSEIPILPKGILLLTCSS